MYAPRPCINTWTHLGMMSIIGSTIRIAYHDMVHICMANEGRHNLIKVKSKYGMVWFMMLNATFNNIPVITCCIEYTPPWARFELTTVVVIGTNCTCSCKSNYHTITTTTAPIAVCQGHLCNSFYLSMYSSIPATDIKINLTKIDINCLLYEFK